MSRVEGRGRRTTTASSLLAFWSMCTSMEESSLFSGVVEATIEERGCLIGKDTIGLSGFKFCLENRDEEGVEGMRFVTAHAAAEAMVST